MNNLINAIIGIALAALATFAGMFYGGQAYQNAQINAVANSIMNESQQILYAERMWSTNNTQPDISGMGAAGASGTGMSALVNGKELAEWPSFAGNSIAVSVNLTNPGIQPTVGGQTAGAATVTTGTWDSGCYSINGYYGRLMRFMFSYNNGNYVAYELAINIPYSAPCYGITNGNIASSPSDVSEINHPIVKIAKVINAAMGQISATANMAYMTYIGLPYAPNGGTGLTTGYDTSGTSDQAGKIQLDANGTVQSNYCYILYGPIIMCVFGPS